MSDAASYPAVERVPPGVDRPFWSVMIPTYHCANYLRQTLRSVLEQAPPDEDMQIEVVDDHSTGDDPQAVVDEVGCGRVAFFRQPQNVGPQANFTTCARRARGQWVHILHGDDAVRQGFYAAIRTGIESDPTVHAAFCRVITINEQDLWLELSELESETAGVIPDLVHRLAVFNHIMFPAIVVRRLGYEQLGGFHPELFHSADWDMWKRIAATYPVWYDPQPLALYRVHQKSDTSRLMRTGANIDDARRAIEIAAQYLPAAHVRSLSRRARRYHALYAVEIADQHAKRRDWSAALAQVRAALRCSSSPRVWGSVLRLACAVAYRRSLRGRPFPARTYL